MRSGRSAARSTRSTARATKPRPDDYVFEGYELEDALEAANGTLEDDVACSRRTAGRARAPFKREEMLKPLERWFFGSR